jgi:hypothetical protein
VIIEPVALQVPACALAVKGWRRNTRRSKEKRVKDSPERCWDTGTVTPVVNVIT